MVLELRDLRYREGLEALNFTFLEKKRVRGGPDNIL